MIFICFCIKVHFFYLESHYLLNCLPSNVYSKYYISRQILILLKKLSFAVFLGIAHACWVLVHLLSLCFGMNSKKEGWSAHDGYTAVAAPAVNICMAEDLNGEEDDIHGETKKGGKFGIIEENGNICRNHNNMGSNLNCMKYQDDKNHNACC